MDQEQVNNKTEHGPFGVHVIDESLAEAQVYSHYPNPNGSLIHLVKVSFPDIGLYINSITVQPSPKYPEKGLWVQLPRYFAKGRWYRPVELSRKSPLGSLISELSIKAVKDYQAKDSDNYIPTDDELENVNDVISKGLDDFIQGDSL